MTEQEKRRRRREIERRMRTRMELQKKGREKGGLTAFRVYVTAVLAGGCLLISLFQTETSQMVCEKVKTVIAVEISAKELAEWKQKVTSYFQEKELSLPAFREKAPQEEKKTYRPDTEESP